MLVPKLPTREIETIINLIMDIMQVEVVRSATVSTHMITTDACGRSKVSLPTNHGIYVL